MIKNKRHILLVYCILSLPFFANLLLIAWADMQFKGYWTSKILAWIWIAASLWLALQISHSWSSKKKITYFIIGMIIFILSTLASMGVVLMAFIIHISTLGDYGHFTLNDNYRLVYTKKVLARPSIYIYKTTNSIFERVVIHQNIDNIANEILDNNSIPDKNIHITQATFMSETANGIFIEYHINNHHKTIFHPFNSHTNQ